MTGPASTSATEIGRIFTLRLARSHADLMEPLTRLYGARPDFAAFTERLLAMLEARWLERPEDLKALDLERDLNPEWFLSQNQIAYVFYIDRFAGRLKDVPQHIAWLKALGVT
ncbi:MAG: hypothetical protein MUC58_09910, partial [Rhizobiaceae bacterium]|nr:hypothetical protein [Rhizobiaceae bacterium]